MLISTVSGNQLEGGSGNDQYQVHLAGGQIVVVETSGHDIIHIMSNHLAKNVSLTKQGNNLGEAGNDRLYGGAGNDLIQGGSGQDHIEGNDGGDLIYGEGEKTFFMGERATTLSTVATMMISSSSDLGATCSSVAQAAIICWVA